MIFSREELAWPRAAAREWLVTNGLGGFASSTLSGMNTRRYHGLLVAALRPPGERTLLVAKLEERVRVQTGYGEEEQEIPLGTNQYPEAIHPQGYRYLLSFRFQPCPTFLFQFPGGLLEKQVFPVYGENITVVRYLLHSPSQPLRLLCQPLLSYRHYHHLLRRTDWPFSQTVLAGGHGTRTQREGVGVEVTAFAGAVPVLLLAERGEYQPEGDWFYQFIYTWESRRGLDDREDLYCPGTFQVELAAGEEVSFLLAAAVPPSRRLMAWREEGVSPGTGASLWRAEVARREGLLESARRFWDGLEKLERGKPKPEIGTRGVGERKNREPWHPTGLWELAAELVLAADAFLVRRQGEGDGESGWTIIAGYPWFTDWGRDTLIALPGLALVTGRFREAKAILQLCRYLRAGLLPNCFPDQGCEPAYNTVDASLWFINAVYYYLFYRGALRLEGNAVGGQATPNARNAAAAAGAPENDSAAEIGEFWPAVRSILHAYREGTAYGIGMDSRDYLVAAGEGDLQLTWMDAKVGGEPVTPRHGKPVEINALWYNALRVGALLAAQVGEAETARDWAALAERVQESFWTAYWLEGVGYLADVVQGGPGCYRRDLSLRPNQLLALSLPFSVLDPRRAAARTAGQRILAHVFRSLYIGYGVRSLAPTDPAYRGEYSGDQGARDRAYHQGTAWSWLLGPLAGAVVRFAPSLEEGRRAAWQLLAPLRGHLEGEAGLGQISEVFSGDYPHTPGGCIAQAWGVGEVLRVLGEYFLKEESACAF